MDASVRAAARQFETSNRRRVLSTQKIVFLVVAAAAPLAAMVGNLPIALSRGLGAATPAAFLFAGVILLCFSVGYAAISRRVVSSGAFYTYVAKGLGKSAGIVAAFTAVLAYVSYTVGMAAFLGYFANLALSAAAIRLAWPVYATGGVAIIAVLGYRSIDLSSKVLGVLMTAELGILLAFDIAVVLSRGWGAFPLESFSPRAVIAPGLGVALMIAFTSFIGFESAALYGEEARDPIHSIPIATYVSVILIAVFYLLTAWLTVGALGAAHARVAAASQGGALMMNLTERYAGTAMMAAMGLLVCTSLLASYLALHNAASRYLFALSREKLLPQVLGQFHPTRYAPSNASVAVTTVTSLFLLGFVTTGRDPYLALIPALIGLGTIGIILVQAMAGTAISAWLWQRRTAGRRVAIAASIIGAAGLAVAALLVAVNFDVLTSSSAPLIAWTPWLYAAPIAGGIAFAAWMRRSRPMAFSVLAETELRPDSTRPIPKIAYDGRYCIVGAGPCGLLAARAFKHAGIPYDHFERHSDVGGIWDIDNPGSSMYDSAHFISSKYTSGFYGFPMPEAFPDYPDHRKLLAYIRGFADRFGLRSPVHFGIEVVKAAPVGEAAKDGWRVELGNGETRRYKGVIVANGVTWIPNRPTYPGLKTFEGEVRHTVTYRSPSELKGKRVLIVGAGNSGVDIACDAARAADAAFLSVRRGYRFVPKHVFGVPTDLFLAGAVRPPRGVALPTDPSEMVDALTGDLTRFGLPAPDHRLLESHPILNSQVLHHLAHGDLIAKKDVGEFTSAGAIFTDGSAETFDTVLFATGYEYRLPFLDDNLFTWDRGHPDLYLNIFHRSLRGLAVLGFIEFASAGYQRFDEMAQMAAMDAYIAQSGEGLAAWWAMKAGHRPNLRGQIAYVDSPRHANYVDVDTYRRTLSEIRERFGWVDSDHGTYDSLRVRPA